jgi:type I restriction-modification system DNA methylase subunit
MCWPVAMQISIDDPHGRYADTLSQRFTEARQYDVVMTNPPFTGSIDKADKSDRFALDTNKTELLFIELLLGGGAQQASVGALPIVGNCR